MPIYILETDGNAIDRELMTSFICAGARGKILCPCKDDTEKFREEIREICRRIYMEKTAAKISAEHKFLYLETAPKFSENSVVIALRNFSLMRSADADDIGLFLAEADRPSEHFEDIIGAKEAKRELGFLWNF